MGYNQNRSTEGYSKLNRPEKKTSSGDSEIVLNIRTLASRPKEGQDQVSGGVSVLSWHVTPVANIL